MRATYAAHLCPVGFIIAVIWMQFASYVGAVRNRVEIEVREEINYSADQIWNIMEARIGGGFCCDMNRLQFITSDHNVNEKLKYTDA
jgi:hypothetical protein